MRFGIGRPPGRQDPADYVLRDFSRAERKELAFQVDRAADAVEALLTDGLEAAQNRLPLSGRRTAQRANRPAVAASWPSSHCLAGSPPP